MNHRQAGRVSKLERGCANGRPAAAASPPRALAAPPSLPLAPLDLSVFLLKHWP